MTDQSTVERMKQSCSGRYKPVIKVNHSEEGLQFLDYCWVEKVLNLRH